MSTRQAPAMEFFLEGLTAIRQIVAREGMERGLFSPLGA